MNTHKATAVLVKEVEVKFVDDGKTNLLDQAYDALSLEHDVGPDGELRDIIVGVLHTPAPEDD